MFSFLHRLREQQRIIVEQAARIAELEAANRKLDVDLYHLQLIVHLASDLQAVQQILSANLLASAPAIIGAWQGETGAVQ